VSVLNLIIPYPLPVPWRRVVCKLEVRVDRVGAIVDGPDIDFVFEAVEELAGVFWKSWLTVLSWLERIPESLVAIGYSGRGEGPTGVVPVVDALMGERADVLVAVDHESVGASDGFEGTVASALRPSVGIEIGCEAAVNVAVSGGDGAEWGLGKNGFEFGAFPISGPTIQEVELAISEKSESGLVDFACIEIGVVYVVDSTLSTYGLVERIARSGFEHPVSEDGETDSADVEFGMVNGDALFDWRWVVGVGKVGDLGAVNHVDPFRMHIVTAEAAGGLGDLGHGHTPVAPYVAVVDIMIVGNDDRWAIFEYVAETPAE